ncbi:hypothetical protein SH2C18_27360 [Clostridium sediminicola]|uniref:TetR/AcrR family transcriptional regulator n=1 Tax=Clostridium sediminicola TaxID=3114879 RepID=UPI0031F27C71
MKELTKRQKQAIDTRNKLIESAEKLFNERSYTDVNIIDICKDVGVSKGSFYYHFPSKIDIYHKFVDNKYEHSYIDKMANYEEMTFDERINQLIEIICDVLLSTGVENFRNYISESIMDEQFVSTLQDRKVIWIFNKIITDAQKSGEISSDIKTLLLTEDFYFLLFGVIVEWGLRGGSLDIGAKLKERASYFTEKIRI